jgi:hypothetical protein
MEQCNQFTYTLQHRHSRAARQKRKRSQRERRKRGNKGVQAQIKSLSGFELETCSFDIMLE